MKKITFLPITFSLLLVMVFGPIRAQERIAVIQDGLVKLLDSNTGDILDPVFITLNSGVPKALIQVGDEIWISYQVADAIERYDLEGNFLSSINTGLDNIRGLGLINGNEVWVCNAGTNNGAPGDAIVRFDLAGNNLGFFLVAPSDSPFDVIDNGNGEAYISYSTSDNIERRDYSGNLLGNIVESGVVDFIQQIEIEEPGVILAGVFSGSTQNGVYRFSETNGTILDFWNVGALRGVAKLGDGNILYSSSSGVSKLDPTTGTSTLINGDSAQFFGHLTLDGCTPPPTPTGEALQTFVEGATLADIVVDPMDVTWFATEADALNNENPLPLSTLLVDGETYYAVNIVDGCLSDPFAVTVTIVLNISEFNEANFSYYPNPTSGMLSLKHSDIISTVSINTVLGQRVLEMQPQTPEVEVNLSHLPNGVYLVTVQTDVYKRTIKIVKE